jgi:Zn-dependent metalloprotease
MNRRRIAMASIVALMTAGSGLAAVQTADAAPASPASPSAPQSAFAPTSFSLDPPADVRKRAIDNAKKALAAHPKQAHSVSAHKFTPRSVVVDSTGEADVRFDRTYHGLKVYGGDVVVHLEPNGSYEALNPAAATPGAVSRTASVSAASAAATSRAQFEGTISKVSKPELAVKMAGRSAALVWETVVSGELKDKTPSKLHVLVDAVKGEVVDTRDEIKSFLHSDFVAKAGAAPAAQPAAALVPANGNGVYSKQVTIDVTQSGSTYSMRDSAHGNGTTTNLNRATSGTGTVYSNTTGSFGNGATSDAASTGVDAHYGAATTFDYFKNVHGRNGIFGDGRGVPSRTHYGNAYINAFWDGTQMTYGDGAGNARPLTELDVAGHEMTHGVSGAIVGWGQNGETGGMSEGTSDIFGTLVEFYANNSNDAPDYTMGEMININGNNTPLRYMYNPSLDGESPNCWSSSIGGLDSHYSMGPLNHWFFLTAVGSGDRGFGNSPTCNNSTVNGIGNDKAGKIWYKALASYANSNENYANARIDSLKAAADLYGTHCTEYNTVNAAWAAVSVTGTDPVPGTCPGQPGAPAVTSPGSQATTVGTAVNLQISATDPNGQALTYSATGLPAGLSISAAGLVSGTPTTAGSSSVTVTAKNTSNLTGTATFTWTVNPVGGGCSTPGEKVGNGGFESGTTPWTTTSGVISANGNGQTARTGTRFAWLNGYGSARTDSATQSVTIPAGCKATLTYWLHIDTAETTTTTQYDKLTVKIGSTTLATYSNLNKATGYAQKTFDVSAFAGQTVTLSFSGVEDSGLQTSFVIDDVGLAAS